MQRGDCVKISVASDNDSRSCSLRKAVLWGENPCKLLGRIMVDVSCILFQLHLFKVAYYFFLNIFIYAKLKLFLRYYYKV